MDKHKQNKLDVVSSATIHKHIQRSIELVKQLHGTFEYAEPTSATDEEDYVTDDLVQRLSSFNIRHCDEFKDPLECSVRGVDEDDTKDDSRNCSLHIEDTYNVDSLQLGSSADFDNDAASKEANNNFELSNVHLEGRSTEQKCENVTTNSNSDRIQPSSSSNDNSDNSQNFRFQLISSEAKDFDNDVTSVAANCSFEMSGIHLRGGFMEQNCDNKMFSNTSNDNIETSRISTNNSQNFILRLDSSGSSEAKDFGNATTSKEGNGNFEMSGGGGAEQECDKSMASNTSSDNIRPSTMQMNSNELNVHGSEAANIATEEIQMSSLQTHSFVVQDSCGNSDAIDGTDNFRTATNQLNCPKDPDINDNMIDEKEWQQYLNDIDNVQTFSVQMDCTKDNVTAIVDQENVRTSNAECNDDGNVTSQDQCDKNEQECDNRVASDSTSDNTQTPSLQMDCSSGQGVHVSDTSSVTDNTQTFTFQTTEPDVATNTDNSQADVDKSTEIDPNTQVTNLDIDNSKKNPPPPTQHDDQPLPLLVKHIQRITWPNQQEICYAPVMEMFGQTFSQVMVYGTVTSLNVANRGLALRFVIDDGSGSISVVWRANTQLIELIQTLQKLDEEVKRCRQSGLSMMNENWQPNSKECWEMLNSFSHVMQYIKREITKRTKLKLFGKVAVVGKPVRLLRKGTVHLHSWNIMDDSGDDRSLEMYHKKNLIRLYEEKYILKCS